MTESSEKLRLPGGVLIKLAKGLKDCVRGQCGNWKDIASREGTLYSECIGSDGDKLTIRISGTGDFAGDGRAYVCQLHGRAVYDKTAQAFEEFTLVAAGQRSGKAGANDRNNDPGPAPMGVAFRLYP